VEDGWARGVVQDALALLAELAPAEGPLFTLRWRDDLGNDRPGELIGEHLTLDAVNRWLDEHEDEGTFEIIDERDGAEACGWQFEMCGGAQACDCGRPECPSNETGVHLYDNPWCREVMDLLDDPAVREPGAFVTLTEETKALVRAAVPSIHDEASFRAALAGHLEESLVEIMVAAVQGRMPGFTGGAS
jgi:hypothetical protein